MKTTNESRKASRIQFRRGQAPLLAALLLAIATPLTQAAPWDVDQSFDPGSTVNAAVRAVAVMDDGKVLIGGFFSTVHGSMCNGLARLNTDGSLDNSFPTRLGDTSSPGVVSLMVQPDGKILVAGSFASVNSVPRRNLARLNPDGTLDNSFLNGLAGPDGGIRCMLLQSDGKILIAGSFASINGTPCTSLARLDSDGSLDSSFLVGVPNPGEWIACMAVQTNGQILIGGVFTLVSGTSCTNLARLNPDGSVDGSFQTGSLTSYDVCSLAIQNNGQILVGGSLNSGDSGFKARVVRLNNDGRLDTNFVADMNPAFNPPLPLVALQPDGKILIGGNFNSFNGMARTNLVRLNADGSLDESFSANLYDPRGYDWLVKCLTFQPDGRILVSSGPDYDPYGGHSFRRLNADGSDDPSFDIGPTGPNDEVLQVTPQPNGRILICGRFASVNGIPRGHLARLMPDGSLDSTFLDHLSGADDDVWTVALQADGKILVGGEFGSFNGEPHPGVVRLNADGSLDTSFLNGMTGPRSGNYLGYVYGLAVQNDGKIIIAGSFSTVNGIMCANIARLNADGSLDTSFTPPAVGGEIRVLVVQPDGKIVVAGFNGIARLNPDGTLDTFFHAAVDQCVWTVAIQEDGKILIGGWFTTVDGVAAKSMARLNADGSLDRTFVQGLPGRDASAYSIVLPGDGRILVGGNCSADGPLAHFVRLNGDGSLDSSFPGALLDRYAEMRCVTLQSVGKIFIAGTFTAVNQVPRSYIARLLSDYLPPAILTPLQSQTAETGGTIEFIVDVTNSFTTTYQWFFDETNLVGCSTNCWIELTNCDFSQSGTYTVVVTNVFGAVTSTPVMLNVIPAVERRTVPGVNLMGEAGSTLNVEYTESLNPTPDWLSLDSVNLTNPLEYWFDLTEPLPVQRFYRVWQTGTPGVTPSLGLHMVPAITLTGNIGDFLRLDYINAIGPTDAWVTLDTVTLTNTSQLYFDTSSIGQPRRLYRIVPGP